MIKKIELANIIGTAIRQVQGNGATDIKSQISDALNAAGIAHTITDTSSSGFVIHADGSSIGVQSYHMPARIELPEVREPEMLMMPTGKSTSRPVHATREFRQVQKNKFNTMARNFNSHRK